MAYAWLNVIMNEGLYDRAFTQKHTNAPMLIIEGADVPLNEALLREGGNPQAMLVWDRKTQSMVEIHSKDIDEDIEYRGTVKTVDGQEVPVKTVWPGLKERADQWTPEAAEEKCWVKADVIRESARMYAQAPAATINVFQGLEEQTNCKDTLQLVNCIIAICGNLEKKGGNLSMPFWNQMGPLDWRRAGYPTRASRGGRACERIHLRDIESHVPVRGYAHGEALPAQRLHHGAGQPAFVGGEHSTA